MKRIVIAAALVIYTALALAAGTVIAPKPAPKPAPVATAAPEIPFSEVFDGPVCVAYFSPDHTFMTDARLVNDWAMYGYLSDQNYKPVPMENCW